MTLQAGSSLTARRARWRLLILAICLVVVSLYSLGLGAQPIPWHEVVHVFLHRLGLTSAAVDPITDSIIWEIRLPRVILGLLAGAALAGSGGVYQAIFRNPMADPYLIGVSAGAALGAVAQLTLRLSSTSTPDIGTQAFSITAFSTPVAAFAGAVASVLLVYRIALRSQRVQTQTLLLAGVAVSSLFGSLSSLLLVTSSSGGQQASIIFWLLGGLYDRSWSEVLVACPGIAAGLTVILFAGRTMDLMLLGDETAQHLGIPAEKARRILLAAATLATASAVAVTGIIGFVGLIVPHVARLLWGASHRVLSPAAILGGAGFLVLSDALARTALAPREIPVGIVTALAGAPFFLVLLTRKRR